MRKGAVAIAVAAAGAMALGACAGNSNSGGSGSSTGGSSATGGGGTASSKTGSAPSGGSGQLTYAADQYPGNWNPDISQGNSTATINGEIRSLPTPYIVNPQFQVVEDKDFNASTPTISKGPYTSKNPFTITYKISPKAVWSDGKPVTADDFIVNWQVNDPTGLPAYKTCQSLLSNMDKIKSITSSNGGKTATVVYKVPFPDWQLQLTSLLPAHLLKKATPAATCKAFNTGWSAKKPPPAGFSAGPWTISSVDASKQQFIETPNPKWWGKAPGLKKIIYIVGQSDSQAISQTLQSGAVDMVYPQPQLDLVSAVSKLSNFTSQTGLGLTFEHLDFNTANKFLKDPVLRKAIAMTIDRDTLTKSTVGQFDSSTQVLNNRIFVNNQKQYVDNAPAQYKKADPAGALKMLTAAGYSFSGGVLKTKAGTPVALQANTTTNNDLRKNTELLVQSQLKAIGIAVTPKQIDAEKFFGAITDQGSLAAGDFDMGLFAWVASPALTANQAIYACVPNNDRKVEQQNYVLGCDKKVDAIMKQAVVTVDPTQAAALWNKADKQLWTDMFTLPLYQKPTFIAYNKKFSGIGDNASSVGPFWNSDTWTSQ